MTQEILNIIHAVKDYRRWTVSNNYVCPEPDFDWFKETERYYVSFDLPEGMDKNRSDYERILAISQYDLDRWDQMEPDELVNESWK